MPFIKRRDGEAPGAYQGWRVSPRYASRDVPDQAEPPWSGGEVPGSEEGYATELRIGSEGTTPDDIRIGKREPPENDPNDPDYNLHQKSDFHRRHAVEQTVTHWNVRQENDPIPKRPRDGDVLPTRPTAKKSPLSYLFTRPWHIPRFVEEIYGDDAQDERGALRRHFSLADHRRLYQIYGMAPRGGVGTNSYRKDPGPWDQDLVYPVNETPERGTSLSFIAGNRSFRTRGRPDPRG